MYKIGSLFSGSGGFELAGMMSGFEPVCLDRCVLVTDKGKEQSGNSCTAILMIKTYMSIIESENILDTRQKVVAI